MLDTIIDDKNGATNKYESNEPTSFEDAIDATRFGKFNIIVLFLCLMATFTIAIDTGSMFFASLAAQCDLNLTLADKGILNAMIYAGMVSSAMLWGFLSDVWGRKNLLVSGLLLDFLFVFLSALSQEKIFMQIAKYLQGFVFSFLEHIFISYWTTSAD